MESVGVSVCDIKAGNGGDMPFQQMSTYDYFFTSFFYGLI